jgi:hypothetical protein
MFNLSTSAAQGRFARSHRIVRRCLPKCLAQAKEKLVPIRRWRQINRVTTGTPLISHNANKQIFLDENFHP